MLTERQKQIYEYILDHQRREGYGPSQRDIQAHFGFASQTTVADHLRLLEKKGVIQKSGGRARAIAIAAEVNRPPVFRIPVYGQIAAGLPQMEQQETEGEVGVDAVSLGIRPNSRTFALKVKGDSMIGAHIVEGDTVILEFKPPSHGDIVAALIDGETTLKRFLVQQGRPFLRAENPAYPDLLPAHELVVQGVMVGLLRAMK